MSITKNNFKLYKSINIRQFSSNGFDEILPFSSSKKILSTGEEIHISSKKKVKPPKSKVKSTHVFKSQPDKSARFNEVNIQMISQTLYNQLFSESSKCEISEKDLEK